MQLTQAASRARALERTDTCSETNLLFPKDRHDLFEQHGYSAAIRSGDLLFVSGQVGSRPDGTPEPDFPRQDQLAFDNLIAVLEAAGCGLGDIVDVTTFHTDPEAQLGAALSELGSRWRNLAFRV
nr:Rid family hydrolase [Hyphomonas sp.]